MEGGGSVAARFQPVVSRPACFAPKLAKVPELGTGGYYVMGLS